MVLVPVIFTLGIQLFSGNYMIRAYTDWMRNFGDIFFYKKEIVVENPREIKSINQLAIQETMKCLMYNFSGRRAPDLKMFILCLVLRQ